MPRKHISHKKQAVQHLRLGTNPVGPTNERRAGLGSDNGRLAIIALALTIATIAVYFPVHHCAFVNYDDGDYVLENAHIRSGPFGSLHWALTTMTTGNWHPLTWMSHALDWQLFGPDPSGHHLMSLGLHCLNAIFLTWFLASATGALGRSIVVAGLFALHPLNVASVAWVAERKNLLCTMFFLLALAAYTRFAKSPAVSRYLAVLALFVLGLASKPMVVTLPFVLLLMDFWPLQRVRGWIVSNPVFRVPQFSFSRCLLEKIPLFVLSAASSLITLVAQRNGGAIKTLAVFPFTVRVENALFAYAMYLWKAAAPLKLAVFYPHPGSTLDLWRICLSGLVLLAISWGVWSARSFAPYLIVGWLWFLGTLVPVIGLVQVGAQALADRYAYIPLIGIFVALVWGIADLCVAYRIKTIWPAAAVAFVLIALSWATRKQIAYWNDSYSLWSHALAVTSDNPVSENQLGMALITLGRQQEAMQHFRAAIALGTHDPTSYLNLGAYLSEHGQQREAIPILEAALRMGGDTEGLVLAHLNLGFAYTSVGEYQNARANYQAASQLDNERVIGTIQGLSQFVASHPSARDYMKLSLLLEVLGQNSEAGAAFERALQLDPSLASARTAMASLKSNRP